jgi:hypothetical protein
MSEIQYKNFLNEMISDNRDSIIRVGNPRNLEEFTISSNDPSIGKYDIPVLKGALKKLDIFEMLNSKKIHTNPDLPVPRCNSVDSTDVKYSERLGFKSKSRVSFNLKIEDIGRKNSDYDEGCPIVGNHWEVAVRPIEKKVTMKPKKKNILKEIRKHIGSDTKFATEEFEFGLGTAKKEKDVSPPKNTNWHLEQKIEHLKKNFFAEKAAEKETQVLASDGQGPSRGSSIGASKNRVHRRLSTLECVPSSHSKKKLDFDTPAKHTLQTVAKRDSQIRKSNTANIAKIGQSSAKPYRNISVERMRSLSNQKLSMAKIKARINTGQTPGRCQNKENLQNQNYSNPKSKQSFCSTNKKVLGRQNCHNNANNQAGFKNEKLLGKFNDKKIENFCSNTATAKSDQFVVKFLIF